MVKLSGRTRSLYCPAGPSSSSAAASVASSAFAAPGSSSARARFTPAAGTRRKAGLTVLAAPAPLPPPPPSPYRAALLLLSCTGARTSTGFAEIIAGRARAGAAAAGALAAALVLLVEVVPPPPPPLPPPPPPLPPPTPPAGFKVGAVAVASISCIADVRRDLRSRKVVLVGSLDIKPSSLTSLPRRSESLRWRSSTLMSPLFMNP
jgi:hypothetical protein